MSGAGSGDLSRYVRGVYRSWESMGAHGGHMGATADGVGALTATRVMATTQFRAGWVEACGVELRCAGRRCEGVAEYKGGRGLAVVMCWA